MDFSFQPHIHHILMHNQLIILNERNDSYMILSEDQTKILTESDKSCKQYNDIFKELVSLNVLSKANGPPQLLNKANDDYEGVDNYTWRTNRGSLLKSFRLLSILQAFLDLIYLKIKLVRHGLGSVLNDMRASKKYLKTDNEIYHIDNLENYVHGIHTASLLLPFKVKCLESSICIFNHIIKSGKSCDFFIGVQLFDFLSHAWVEIDGKVVADDKDLSRKLPKILTI